MGSQRVGHNLNDLVYTHENNYKKKKPMWSLNNMH